MTKKAERRKAFRRGALRKEVRLGYIRLTASDICSAS